MMLSHSITSLAALTLSLASLVAAKDYTINILFVGTSYTHGKTDPVLHYGNSTVSDVRATGFGGVPAIVRQLNEESPDTVLSYNTTILAHDGPGVDWQWFASNYASTLNRRDWHVVILQEAYGALHPMSRGGDPLSSAKGLRAVYDLIRTYSGASVYLTETWPTPEDVFKPTGHYWNCGSPDIYAQANDLTINTGALGAPYFIESGLIVRVGWSFIKAIQGHYATENPISGPNATVNLWDSDNINASRYGSYLSALTILSTLTSAPLTNIPTGPGSVADALGISSSIAAALAGYAETVV